MSNRETNKQLVALLLSSAYIFTNISPTYSSIVPGSYVTGHSGSSNHVLNSSPLITRSTPEVLLASSGEGVNSGTTSAVVGELGGATRECRSVGDTYAASCVARAFRKAASKATNPAYFDARRELRKAAKELDKLVAKNADKSAPKKKGKNGSYKAVKKESVAAVKKAAIKIITETETKLLRSSGNEIKKVHYKRIAQAVGSTKVLFRS